MAHLVIGPAAAGKTRHVIERARTLTSEHALAQVWLIAPESNQARGLRQRLAAAGGALGVQVGVFADVSREILALADRSVPEAPDPLAQRVAADAVDALLQVGTLQHYAGIGRTPGFIRALRRLIAELKRNRILPEDFARLATPYGLRLLELAALYHRYQTRLLSLDWADPEGLGWLAIEALDDPQHTLRLPWRAVLVDGFDSFTPTQLDLLARLATRIPELTVTLTGQPGDPRRAHRRYVTTLGRLRERLPDLTLEHLPANSTRPEPLRRLEAALFDRSDGPTVRRSVRPNAQALELQSPEHEAREALRWIKARVVRDGVRVGRCAIITNRLDPYEPALRAAAREFGVPIEIARFARLADNPAVAALLTALDLALGQFATRPLFDLLRSPYLDLNRLSLTPEAVDQLEAIARWGQITGGRTQWDEAFELLAQAATPERHLHDEPALALARGPGARLLQASLHQLFERLRPPATGTLDTYMRWLDQVREGIGREPDAGAVPESEARQNDGMPEPPPDPIWVEDPDGVALADLAAERPNTPVMTPTSASLDLAQRDAAARTALSELLADLLRADALLAQGPIDYPRFYDQVRGAVEAAGYRVAIPPDQAVYVSDVLAARGVIADAVAVLGLAEGNFPAPVSEDPFLSDLERQELKANGLDLELSLRSDQQSLFYEAVTRAERFLLLTRPYLSETGESWPPSPYWTAALEALALAPDRRQGDTLPAPADAASVVEVLTTAARRRRLPAVFAGLRAELAHLTHAAGVLADQLGPLADTTAGDLSALRPQLQSRFGHAHVWSPSQFETYTGCGYRFLVERVLALEAREEPETGYDAAQLGAMLHDLLERIVRRVPDLDPTTLDTAIAELAPTVFDQAPRVYGFRPTRLWPVQQRQLLVALRTTLLALAQQVAEGFRPEHFEVDFEALVLDIDDGPIRVRGRIDRIDVDPHGRVRVIDYKTGSSGLSPDDLITGRRLQLPLYALAAERALALGQVVDGWYWKIRQAAPSALRLATFVDEDRQRRGPAGAVATVLEHVARAVAGIRAGQFAPTPPADGCPSYCAAATWCARYQPGAWAGK
jgi:ATP-dependent helicase/DNAse subunit B